MLYKLNRTPKGASLATVMMVVAMMLALAFTVLAIAFSHLNLANKNGNNSMARNLAEATLSKAVSELVHDQGFGNEGDAEARTVRVTFDSLPAGSEGVLSFDQAVAADEGVPYSTNNQSDGGSPGVGAKVVPPWSVHLVAKGTVKGSTSVMEAILHIPKFPYSVASEGAIRSNGGLVVASVKPGVPYDLNYPLHEDDLEPGHMVSNSEVGDEAIVLSGENKIYGDIQSSSGVTIEEDTVILGEVRTQAEKEALDRLEVWEYDPEGKPGTQTVNSGAGQLDVTGLNKSYGSLTVDNGIRLNGGVLFVDGDLTVSAGGVSGKGALISTGDITIYGDGEAVSDNQAALIADGDVVLKGSSSEKAKFAGLIYTNGNLQAENLRLAGVFVAAGANSNVSFDNTEVYEDSTKAEKIEVSNEPTTSVFELPTLTPPTGSFEDKPIPTSYDMSALSANLENYRNPNTAAGQPEYLFKFKFGTVYKTFDFTSGSVTMVDTTGPDSYVVDGSTFGLKIFGQPVSTLTEAENAAVNGMVTAFAAEGRTLTDAEKALIRTSAKNIFASTTSAYTLCQASATYSYDNFVASGNPSGGGASGDPEFYWSLDFSEFYNKGENMEVEYWAEYREI